MDISSHFCPPHTAPHPALRPIPRGAAAPVLAVLGEAAQDVPRCMCDEAGPWISEDGGDAYRIVMAGLPPGTLPLPLLHRVPHNHIPAFLSDVPIDGGLFHSAMLHCLPHTLMLPRARPPACPGRHLGGRFLLKKAAVPGTCCEETLFVRKLLGRKLQQRSYYSYLF